MRASLIFVTPLAILAVVSCGDDKPASSETEQRSGVGQVLGGTVSDAMIPLDTLRSTSPVDPAAARSAGPPSAEAEAAEAGSATQGDAENTEEEAPAVSEEASPDEAD